MSSSAERRPRKGQVANSRQRARRHLYGFGASVAAVAGTFAAPATDQAAAQSQHDAKANNIVRTAHMQEGKRFSSGATGPTSFDCSGFTQYVYQKANIHLPRTSQAQYRAGQSVSRSNIQPGDLVFFSTDGAGPTHVGIAVSKDSAVSATSHGVRQHSISGSYWGAHYVGARRAA